MRPVQKFSAEYLERCRDLAPEEIVRFLEDFRTLHGGKTRAKSRLISIKMPEDLLSTFRAKADLTGVAYQTQIKRLMIEWLAEN